MKSRRFLLVASVTCSCLSLPPTPYLSGFGHAACDGLYSKSIVQSIVSPPAASAPANFALYCLSPPTAARTCVLCCVGVWFCQVSSHTELTIHFPWSSKGGVGWSPSLAPSFPIQKPLKRNGGGTAWKSPPRWSTGRAPLPANWILPGSCPSIATRTHYTLHAPPPSLLVCPSPTAVLSPDVIPRRQCRVRTASSSSLPSPPLLSTSLSADPTLSIANRRRYSSPVKPSKRPPVPSVQLLSFVLLAIVLVIQFILPQIRGGNEVFGGDYTPTRSTSIYSPTLVLPRDAICKSPLPFPVEGKQSRVRTMGLLEEAKKVAAEFEYPPEAVNAGVKEFLREMGEHDQI